MLLEAETNKYCPGGYDFGTISNLITWVLNFFFSVERRPIKQSNMTRVCMPFLLLSLLALNFILAKN
jgi:hypothetical protein